MYDKKKQFNRNGKKNGKFNKEISEGCDQERDPKRDRKDRNRKSSRGFSKSEGLKEVTVSNTLDSGKSLNDSSWYYINDKMGEAVGSIPYNVFAGERIDVQPGTGLTDASYRSIPGVLTLRYCNAVGKSNSAASAINIAAKALYSYVRHMNSGHSNYESSDLILYILAMDSIYSAYFEAVRIYQTAMTYDYVNRNIPDVLLTSMGVTPDNIRANLAQFRAGLNIFAAKLSSLAVPNTFHLFKRHALLASSVFMDSTSMRGQFYLFNRDSNLIYDPAYSTQGGGLRATARTNSNPNIGGLPYFSDILADLNSMLDPVIQDEDMNIMSGDILKAFGKESLYVVPMVDEDSTVPMVYDENILAQIENAVSETPTSLAQLDIYQSNNLIVANPTFTYSNFIQKHIFNSHKDQPSWQDALEWSRNITFNGYFGTEIITGLHIQLRDYSGSGVGNVADFSIDSFVSDQSTDFVRRMTILSHFDWHPIFYIFGETNTVWDKYLGFVGDVKKFTLLSTEEIQKLHDSAIMGEFNTLLLSRMSSY